MRLLGLLATTFASAPAWAHEGAHLHPHGTEGIAILLLSAAVAAAVIYMVRR